MSEHIVVAVSPFYNGRGWTDRMTGISFDPSKTINAIRIDFDKHQDLSGIKNSIRLNNLLLLEGTIPGSEDVTIDKLNPEELTKEQFDNIVKQLKSNSDNSEEVASLKGQVEKLNGQVTEKTQALSAKEEELKKAKTDLSSAQSELSTAQEKIKTLEKQLEEAKAPVEEPVTAMASVGGDLSSFTVSELKDIAKEQNIEIKSTDKKEDIIQKLEAAK